MNKMADIKTLEKIDSTPDLKNYVAKKKNMKAVVLIGASVRISTLMIIFFWKFCLHI